MDSAVKIVPQNAFTVLYLSLKFHANRWPACPALFFRFIFFFSRANHDIRISIYYTIYYVCCATYVYTILTSPTGLGGELGRGLPPRRRTVPFRANRVCTAKFRQHIGRCRVSATQGHCVTARTRLQHACVCARQSERVVRSEFIFMNIVYK